MRRVILIVDDNSMNRAMLGNMLTDEYDVLEAENGKIALEVLNKVYPDISAVLLDISMPVMDGYETLRLIRASSRLSSLPVVMITGSDDEETRIQSLSLGANDFVMKPYSAEIIKHCLKNQISFQEAEASVEALLRDRLTGVYNRDAFFEKAAGMIAAAPEGRYVLSCVDINGFKVINDQYGSEAGDRVLMALAARLQRFCDGLGGICGRISADNFVTLRADNVTMDYPFRLKNMGDAIREATGIKATFSVGQFLVDDKSLSVSAMYDRAKIAQATVKGRFDVCAAMFDESMRLNILRKQEVVSEMSGALENGQFEAWLQPQYNHATGALVGAEALVRWRHPGKGLIPPGDFIPIFEQNGFIYALDQFVWEKVCGYLRAWSEEGRNPLPISVNISRYDVLCPDLIEKITALTDRYQIPRDLLRLEITESAFSKDSERVIAVVKQLVELGFTVEIDDFGSGYSSLNTLKDVPAQIIKLDMKFLQSSADLGRGGNIVESVVRMAKWLGMAVIAEGVEEASQADYLTSIGSNYVQGYLYARPMPVEAFVALAREARKEERLLKLETAENLDNNTFWDPNSMDTLIFNSYVGAACIFEFFNDRIDLLRVSKKYTRLFEDAEFGMEKAMKLNWVDFLSANGLRRLKESLMQSVQTQEDVSCELVFRGLPGLPPKVYLRFRLRVIARVDTRLLVYCIYENITEQREAEKREANLTAQMQSILETISSGVTAVVIHEDGTTEPLMMTDKYLELLGYTREQIMSELSDLFAPIVPEDSEWVREKSREVMRTGQTQTFEFRAMRRDGQKIWLQVTVSMARLDGADGVAQIGVFTDVTKQKMADEAARISDEEYRIAIQNSGKLIYRYDHGHHTVDMQQNVAQLFGLETHGADGPERLIANGVVAEESAEAYRAFFAALERGEPSGSTTVRCKLKDGSWRWYSGVFNNVFNSEGTPVSAVIMLEDVTEQREKEAVYEKWQQSLLTKDPQSFTLYRWNLNRDKLIGSIDGSLLSFRKAVEGQTFEERTVDFLRQYVHPKDWERYAALMNPHNLLVNYQLGKRVEMLDYRGIMPDGRTLWIRLTVEMVEYSDSKEVYAYLMYEDINEAKTKELLIQRQAQTDPLTGLLNRKTFVERFTRLMEGEGGREALSALFVIDLDGFKQVNDTFGHAIGDETLIEIAMKLRENFREQDLLCRLGGDEYLIFMHNVPHISAVNEKASLICALLHKSFSLDVQVSASIGVAVFRGDGEGFENLYRKADAALYHVKASGKDGYALYEENMADKPKTQEKPPEAPAPAPHIGSAPKRRMLIVEDNEINRDFLTSLFMDDFIIETAAEGTSALVRLKRYGAGISIVLLDLRMPGLDGFAVLHQMRQSLATQAIPVIVVSGLDEHENALKAIREGASDFITKPVDAELLRLRVASALSKAENERLRAQNRFLAIQNEETKRLAEAKRHSEELALALRAAEQADLAKTHFLSNMSHEIRTPLNAVIGYNSIAKTEMAAASWGMENGNAGMKVMDCLTKSEIASKQLLTIINDVLDISAIEAGKMKVDDAPVDFRSLITSLTVMFFSQARAKGVNFEVLFDKPTDEWFRGDQLRVNQVLTNLLSNAVKFTPEGGSVTLTITEEESDAASAAFTFVITDTGIGMTQEYLEHIWTPFEQAEASISRRFGGSGLGLSITKNLVELMGGAITVKSASGVGSTFTVRLGFRRVEQPQAPAGTDFSDVRALVVDDDISTCDYIKLMFDRCGARCATYTSGARAVEAFAAALETDTPFTLCLVDWKMPMMDGFSTIREIRRIAGRQLPVVVVTAYDFTEVSEQAEQLGINRFISKPLFQSSLFDLLATVGGRQLSTVSDMDTKFDFDNARVLLVEDNNMNMEVAKQILTTANLAVDGAWNGQEAVDIFLASRPGTYKAILMDVHMPQMDGYQATRLIRGSAHPDAKTVPIIAMTADVFVDDVAEAREAGMNDHIGKPIDVDALYQMLSQYVKEPKQ